MYNTQSNKRKESFNINSTICKIPRLEQQTLHDHNTLENLLSKDRILHYACDSFKSYQTLQKVNKRIQSFSSNDYVNSVKICIKTDRVYKKHQSTSFIYQYRNVKLTFDDADHTMDFLEEQLPNITHFTIAYRGSSPLTVTFTDKKWLKLVSISLEGKWHNIYLSKIPDTVCHLRMRREIDSEFEEQSFEPIIYLPPKLKTLKICSPETFRILDYPESLEKMTLLVQGIEYLPTKVCMKRMLKLRLGYSWNLPILKTNFPELTHLHLSGRFNQSVDNLPPNITYLSFEGHFNQAVDQLPTKLTHLSLSGDFKQSVDNLPNTLQHLSLIGDYNRSIDFLPSSITHLTLSCKIEANIEKLPNLKFLSIATKSKRTTFPPTLEMLVTRNVLHEDNFLSFKVSNCLKYLQLNIHEDETVIYVPAGVIHFQLTSSNYYAQAIIHLPDTVKTVCLCHFNGGQDGGLLFYPQDWQSRISFTFEEMKMLDHSMDAEQEFV